MAWQEILSNFFLFCQMNDLTPSIQFVFFIILIIKFVKNWFCRQPDNKTINWSDRNCTNRLSEFRRKIPELRAIQLLRKLVYSEIIVFQTFPSTGFYCMIPGKKKLHVGNTQISKLINRNHIFKKWQFQCFLTKLLDKLTKST